MTQRRCNQCNLTKDIEEFGINNTQPLGKSYMCRVCRREYDKNRYKADPESNKARVYRSRSSKVQERKLLMWDLLSKAKCVDCGVTDPIVMEFDHREDSAKLYNIGAMIGNSYSWNTILKEIEKCDTVCANCHRHRTMKRGSWWRTIAGMTEVERNNEMA